MLAEGHSTKEIAARLSVSSKTGGTHREHIMGKVQLHSIAELTRYAIREGLTSLDTSRGDQPGRAGSQLDRARSPSLTPRHWEYFRIV